MTLAELIEQAKARNILFRKTMEKKKANGKKHVPMAWLMKHLENILGKSYCLAAARAEIDKQMRGTDEPVPVVKSEGPETTPKESEQAQP
jgi:hypothetical protein